MEISINVLKSLYDVGDNSTVEGIMYHFCQYTNREVSKKTAKQILNSLQYLASVHLKFIKKKYKRVFWGRNRQRFSITKNGISFLKKVGVI